VVALDKTTGVKFTLKTIREMRGLSQIDAAKAIGISVDTLSNYERGKSYPDIPVLRKIEKTYNIKYNQLIFLPLDYGLTVND
jgi:transcriptional regulator with XRE-family HTH domain